MLYINPEEFWQHILDTYPVDGSLLWEDYDPQDQDRFWGIEQSLYEVEDEYAYRYILFAQRSWDTSLYFRMLMHPDHSYADIHVRLSVPGTESADIRRKEDLDPFRDNPYAEKEVAFIEHVLEAWAHWEPMAEEFRGMVGCEIVGFAGDKEGKEIAQQAAQLLEAKSLTYARTNCYVIKFEGFEFWVEGTELIPRLPKGGFETTQDFRQRATIYRRMADKLELFERVTGKRIKQVKG